MARQYVRANSAPVVGDNQKGAKDNNAGSHQIREKVYYSLAQLSAD
jgi:hypothetical protein